MAVAQALELSARDGGDLGGKRDGLLDLRDGHIAASTRGLPRVPHRDRLYQRLGCGRSWARAGAPSGAPDILPSRDHSGQLGVRGGERLEQRNRENTGQRSGARPSRRGQEMHVVGDTYWVQSTTAPSTADALVDIHDSAPTTDQWNYAAVEIVATRQYSVGCSHP